ncbi:DUF7948 domain-containing protein [Halpernia frigidisoli]|uniref:DUF7948 domain-containing protein n=1 Tax=Halpernia frigidisoli TaxID=1125876 RepID=A0A1I3F419_9FLAO|nr:hypothetical protein [Halpernia frigidisoli]SFI05900.1 hypothetical protein SAMN05443292_1140 [Halpernia frigidisoli]
MISINFLSFAQKAKQNFEYSFYENKGQIIDQSGKQNKEVKFLYISNGLNVQIKKTGFSYDVYESERKEISPTKKSLVSISRKQKPNFKTTQKFHRVDIDFENSNPNVEIIAEDQSTDYDNYYNIPNIPKGVEKVYRYRKVTYKNLYPNIDLEFFKPSDTLKPVEYNFIVKPGGKISNIQLKFNGAKTKLKDGKLYMKLRFGEMQENIPNSWIEDLTSKKDIKVNFKETGNQTFGFKSAQDSFDKTVVIDPTPTRIWATYYFGSSYEPLIKTVRTDSDENIITTTQVDIFSNNNLVTSGAFQTNFKNVDEYSLLSKFNKDGQRLWSTFIGNYSYYINGGLMNVINDCVVNNKKEIYIVGKAVEQISNYSNNITTPGAHKEIATGSRVEGEIMKFNENGGRIWGTYFGGDSSDEILSVSLDSNQDLIISGRTYSDKGIVTANPYKSFIQNSYYIGFFAKFSSAGNQIYGSYLPDVIYHNAVDKNDNYIFCAYSYDKSFPSEGTSGTHQPIIVGQANSLLIKFDKNFNKIWGTYYGGTLLYGLSGQHDNENFPFGVGTDSANNIYIAGNTTAKQNIATPNSHKENFSGTGSDVFLAKIDENGNRIWGTYFGANTGFDDKVHDLFVKSDGSLYIAGVTGNSTDIATSNGYINDFKTLNYVGGFLTKFNSSGMQLWGTYYPEIFSIFNSKNNIYSYSYSVNNFGTSGTFMPAAVYGATFLLTKFQDCPDDLFVSATSPVCPNSDINLKASGGTSYAWTGPNNFKSTDQNPTISNANSINSGTYYCKITGSGDCDGTFSVDVKVEDKTPPIPNITNLPDIKGDCNTVVSVFPTAIDGCMGNIIATTKNPLQYSIPGTYVVVWDYDDGNGNIAHQNQNVIISSPALPTANATQEFCSTENRTVADLQILGQNITWYDAAGTVLDPTSKLVNGDYFASQNSSGCESDKIKVSVKINVTALPTANANQDFCSTQKATISDLKVTGTGLKFYDLAGNSLPTSTLLLDNTSYFVTQTSNSCESDKFEIKVAINQNALPANDFGLSFCNDTTSTSKIEDLTKYEENLISNSSGYIFDYFDQNQNPINDFKSRTLSIGNNVFYVKVSTAQGCFKLVKLTLQLNEKPVINLPETAEFCNGLSVILNPGNNPNYSYEWSTGETTNKIQVDKEGTYTVKVKTSFGCENTASIIVKKSVLANILKVEILNNNATVILSANGDFEYSLDNKSARFLINLRI